MADGLLRDGEIFIGAHKGGAEPQYLKLNFANRHGLIAGATGTGKSVTLQVLTEGLSNAGVPVFLADVKGDLAGLSQPGGDNPKLQERAEQIGLGKITGSARPVVFWDLFGKQGHPVRTTISEMGPVLLARLLDLNDTQEGVLTVAFAYADDNGLAVLDMKDLQSLLTHIADNATEIRNTYGSVSSASVGAIQRRLLGLRQEGADDFFGEPALSLQDFMRTDQNGHGVVNILAADKLMMSPKLYSTFLLWLLSELFEELPEVGDPKQPKLVFIFDEAHLLFDDAPKALIEKVENVVRLIRSKGVGVYFVTQNPIDVPDTVLGQLGNRAQHALRAFTPRDQKAVKAAAQTFRENPDLDVEEVISELGVGEALVSTLQEKGIPSIVQRTLVRPPSSRLGAITEAERATVIAASPFAGKYDTPVDRESAYELLAKKADDAAAEAEQQKKTAEAAKAAKSRASASHSGRSRQSSTEVLTNTVLREVGRQVTRSLIRGILGSLTKGR